MKNEEEERVTQRKGRGGEMSSGNVVLIPACGVKMYCVVVVALSLLAKILGDCSTIHSPPALFCYYSKWRLARAH